MSRNLVVCCDGTNNEFGYQNTSVIRLVQVLERDPRRQLLYYDGGVGTLPEPGLGTRLGKAISKVWGLAFGAGLTWKVEQAYTFLMENFEPGDRVFLFGFSRGAYAARVLAGFLYAMGLLPRGSHNMVPYAMRLFRAIREQEQNDPRRSVQRYWRLCDEFRQTFSRPMYDGDGQRRCRVRFVGVWDTVSSVGWIWDPAKFQYTARNPGVEIIRHAVSIDERRWFFRQNLFKRAGDRQDLQEQWFAGVHADVGGGYPEADGRLWQPAFDWIREEARSAGLLVDQKALEIVLSRPPLSQRPWSDPAHESLTARWWPAEFFPKWRWNSARQRNVLRIGRGRPRTLPRASSIDASALNRIRDANYAPRNLEAAFIQKVKDLPAVNETLLHP